MPKTSKNPYQTLPRKAFWTTGVGTKQVSKLEELWHSKWSLPSSASFVTYGSCFAQHITKGLQEKELNWFNAEPEVLGTSPLLMKKFNYGVFSARTGNIYTLAQLLQWLKISTSKSAREAIEIWKSQKHLGRFVVSIMPNIEPFGLESEEEAKAILETTTIAFRKSIECADVFIFTMGLTEYWRHKESGQVYALCPGTNEGLFDESKHEFHNTSLVEALTELDEVLRSLLEINPKLRVLLTVSPVPLVASNDGGHILVANSYSKSLLRAVAGEFSKIHDCVDYFPSYEIIAASSQQGKYFEDNLRQVTPQGVELAMMHFFEGLSLEPASHINERLTSELTTEQSEVEHQELICEEMILEAQREK